MIDPSTCIQFEEHNKIGVELFNKPVNVGTSTIDFSSTTQTQQNANEPYQWKSKLKILKEKAQ